MKQNKGCSKHGENGVYECNECWAKLGEFLRELEDKEDITIHMIGTKDEKEKLDM